MVDRYFFAAWSSGKDALKKEKTNITTDDLLVYCFQ